MAIINVPRPLREKLGEEAVDSLIELLNKFEEKAKGDIISLSEEKYERRLGEEVAKFDKRITEEITKLDKRITEEITKLDKRITEEITKLDKRITEEITKLDKRISDVKADIIKWMFIFWIGQIGTLLVFTFFKP